MVESLQMLDRSMLKELGVILIGETLCILKQAKEATTQASHVQGLAAKPPHLNLDMTLQQFQKFWIDRDIFTKMTEYAKLSGQYSLVQLCWWDFAKCHN